MCAAVVEREPGLSSFNDDPYRSNQGQQRMSWNQDFQKREQEARRHDNIYGRRNQAPEKPELFDYKKQQQQNYEEKRKEYQEFLKKKEEEAHMKKPVTPPGLGLDIGKHDLLRKQQHQAIQEKYKSDLDKQKQEQLFQRVQELQRDSSPVFMGYIDSERPLVGAHKEYEIRQMMLAEERRKDYNDILKQKDEEAQNSHKRSPTPPVGLNILTQEERRRRDAARKKVYREELLMQQKEQMLSKAQHQIEMPVIDRRPNGSPQKTSSQLLESRPPPPQEYDRMPPSDYNRRSRDGQNQNSTESRQTPAYWDGGKRVPSPAPSVEANNRPDKMPMTSMEQQISNDHAYEDRKQQLMREIGVDKEARDRQYRDMLDRDRDARDRHAQEFHRHDEQLRDKNIMEYLEKKRIEEERQFNHPRKKKLDALGRPEENFDPGRYEEMKQRLQDDTHREYKRELAKDTLKEGQYGLPIGQWRYDQQIKERQRERNKEYNEFLKAQKKKHPENPKRMIGKRPDSGKDPAKNPSKQIGYMAYPGAREHDRKRMQDDRSRDFNGYAPEFNGRPSINPIGQPIWIEDRDRHLDYQPSWYNQEVAPVGLATPNKDDYRQPRERIGSYNHRDYVRDSPTYQEMLESKRRHEAAYRRYDDPELNRFPQTGHSDPGSQYSPRRF